MLQGKQPAAQAAGQHQAHAEAAAATAASGQDSHLKTVLEGLEELWNEHQYAEEFGMEGFLGKLASQTTNAGQC